MARLARGSGTSRRPSADFITILLPANNSKYNCSLFTRKRRGPFPFPEIHSVQFHCLLWQTHAEVALMSLCSIRAYEVTCLCGLRSYVATLHGVAIRATCIYVSRTLYATYVMHEATVYEGGYFSNRCACIFICCRLLLYWLSVACLCLIQLQAGLTAQSAVIVFRLLVCTSSSCKLA